MSFYSMSHSVFAIRYIYCLKMQAVHVVAALLGFQMPSFACVTIAAYSGSLAAV